MTFRPVWLKILQNTVLHSDQKVGPGLPGTRFQTVSGSDQKHTPGRFQGGAFKHLQVPKGCQEAVFKHLQEGHFVQLQHQTRYRVLRMSYTCTRLMRRAKSGYVCILVLI